MCVCVCNLERKPRVSRVPIITGSKRESAQRYDVHTNPPQSWCNPTGGGWYRANIGHRRCRDDTLIRYTLSYNNSQLLTRPKRPGDQRRRNRKKLTAPRAPSPLGYFNPLSLPQPPLSLSLFLRKKHSRTNKNFFKADRRQWELRRHSGNTENNVRRAIKR